MKKDPIKLIVAAIAGAYFLWCAYDPYQWHLIDGVNLVIHEAGHLIFRPFGEFMMIAGGSLLVLFWVGESILNVSVYAGDSLALQLPLLGGQDSVHDWNYLLSAMNLLPATAKIAAAIRLLGTLAIVLACVGGFKFATKGEANG